MKFSCGTVSTVVYLSNEIMSTQTADLDLAIVEKTRELCETIIAQPDFQRIRNRIDAFMADDAAKIQYQTVMEKGDTLQQKQQMGVQLTAEEISEFEKNRDALVNNPVARDFLDAQQAMQKVQQSVGQYVSKTFELGRTPTDQDFDSGSCGSGCGCHH
jgi:cell fate (sporulation/competence/biofilm development) regulator YlbF (YheA/YmcA/DUF963 family)